MVKNNKRRILIIEPHSDDSAIAAGGYLNHCSKNECELYFVLVSASSLRLHHGDVSREERIKEYNSYVNSLGGTFLKPTSSDKDFKFPLDKESKLDKVSKANLVNAIEKSLLDVLPDEVLVMGPSFHHDHTIVYEAVRAATRPTFRFCPKSILIMENPTYVHSWEGMSTPNSYFPLSKEDLENKLDRFETCFPSQIRKKGNYLSKSGITKWSEYRGFEARCDYAEAFYSIFRLI